MIEVPVAIDITRGLTPNLLTDGGLRRSVNVYPKKDQLVSVLGVDVVWNAATNVGYSERHLGDADLWPWPQLVRLGKFLYVCYPTSISIVRPYGIELLLDNIPSRGYPWGATIVGEFPVFVNNYMVVHPSFVGPLATRVKDIPYDGLMVQSGSFPNCRDVCEFNGQFIVAAPWMYAKLHHDHVAWSAPGQVDFTLDTESSAGYKFVQGCGSILRVLATDKGFNAYGTHGVASFKAVGFPASYSHEQIGLVGLHNQRAAVAGKDFQMFVGTDHRLYLVTETIKLLDYQYIFEEAVGDIVLHYDEEEGLVYASF